MRRPSMLAITSRHRRPGPACSTPASNILQQKLTQVTGVGQVVAGRQLAAGGARRDQSDGAHQVRIGLESVRAALAAANANSPKGALEDGEPALPDLFQRPGDARPDEYRPLIIAWRNGAPVRLSDVAEVIDATENIRNEGQANGKRSVLVIIYLQPNANVIETVDDIRALLPELQAALPNDVELQVVSDRTVTIRASLKEVEQALLIEHHPGRAGDLRLPALGPRRLRRRPSPCRCR